MEAKSRNNYIFIILVFIIGLLIGMQIGEYIVLKSIAVLTGGFINIDLMKEAIFQYQNHVKECYPNKLENASIFNDAGN
jgi:hypothetical protein